MSRKRPSSIVVKRLEPSEETFAVLFEMLIELHKIGGYAPLDAEKSAAHAYGFLKEGLAFVAFVNGKPAGCLCGVEIDFWYSQTSFLQSIPLYVRPQYAKSKVGTKLCLAFREEAQRRGLLGFVTVDNPDRKRKPSWTGVESHLLGFIPLGYTLKLR